MKPHFGHLYDRPNFLHFLHRHMVISPQFGHWNFVASLRGGMGLLQDVHIVNTNVLSVMFNFLSASINCICGSPLYLLCSVKEGKLLLAFKPHTFPR